MASPDQMTTAEAVSYLGIGRSSLKRYQKAKRIAPVAQSGQTDMWATADLNTLRQELTKQQITAVGRNSPMSAGKQPAADFEKNLATIEGLVPADASILDRIELDGDDSYRMLERKVQDGFRAYIATVLDKTAAVKIIAADLYNPNPKVRQDAFQLLAKYFLPTLQATSVEKVGVEKKKDGDSRIAEALKRIEAVERDQAALAAAPMKVLEGEIVEE